MLVKRATDPRLLQEVFFSCLGELDWDLKFGQDFVMLPWDSE